MLDEESEHFDCDTCHVREVQATLDAENVEAWHLYHRLYGRMAVDLQLGPVLFPYLVAGWPAQDVLDLADRLAIVHDVLSPPAPRQDD